MKYLFCILLLFFYACGTPDKAAKSTQLSTGAWLLHINTGGRGAYIQFKFDRGERDDSKITFSIAGEDIEARDLRIEGDSVFFKTAIFETEFRGRIHDSESINGRWHNYDRAKDYSIGFDAHKIGNSEKMDIPWAKKSNINISGKWDVKFAQKGKDPETAIGIFQQNGQSLTGTFRTETGDYRYLEGIVSGDSLFLWAFDGAHLFSFEAQQHAGQSLSGIFRSGNHWSMLWVAERSEDVELRKPEDLTFIKEGYEGFAFSFPDLDSQVVSLTDKRFQGKVVIAQILGSWCPNCLDESRLYSTWYKKYHHQGLEIIGLSFERPSDFGQAAAIVKRYQERVGIPYPILVCGKADKKIAAQAFPMLNHVMSFPTSIFMDRQGKIQRIHTGFNGPGTGEHYRDYVRDYEAFLEKMLRGNEE